MEIHPRLTNPNDQIDWSKMEHRLTGPKTAWEKKCIKVVTKLHSVVPIEFFCPVDPNAAGNHNYLTVIKRPMDLHTIHLNLRSRQYISLAEVKRDFDLIGTNCFTFYEENTDEYYTGLDFKEAFDKLWKKCRFNEDQSSQDTDQLKSAESTCSTITRQKKALPALRAKKSKLSRNPVVKEKKRTKLSKSPSLADAIQTERSSDSENGASEEHPIPKPTPPGSVVSESSVAVPDHQKSTRSGRSLRTRQKKALPAVPPKKPRLSRNPSPGVKESKKTKFPEWTYFVEAVQTEGFPHGEHPFFGEPVVVYKHNPFPEDDPRQSTRVPEHMRSTGSARSLKTRQKKAPAVSSKKSRNPSPAVTESRKRKFPKESSLVVKEKINRWTGSRKQRANRNSFPLIPVPNEYFESHYGFINVGPEERRKVATGIATMQPEQLFTALRIIQIRQYEETRIRTSIHAMCEEIDVDSYSERIILELLDYLEMVKNDPKRLEKYKREMGFRLEALKFEKLNVNPTPVQPLIRSSRKASNSSDCTLTEESPEKSSDSTSPNPCSPDKIPEKRSCEDLDSDNNTDHEGSYIQRASSKPESLESGKPPLPMTQVFEESETSTQGVEMDESSDRTQSISQPVVSRSSGTEDRLGNGFPVDKYMEYMAEMVSSCKALNLGGIRVEPSPNQAVIKSSRKPINSSDCTLPEVSPEKPRGVWSAKNSDLSRSTSNPCSPYKSPAKRSFADSHPDDHEGSYIQRASSKPETPKSGKPPVPKTQVFEESETSAPVVEMDECSDRTQSNVPHLNSSMGVQAPPKKNLRHYFPAFNKKDGTSSAAPVAPPKKNLKHYFPLVSKKNSSGE